MGGNNFTGTMYDGDEQEDPDKTRKIAAPGIPAVVNPEEVPEAGDEGKTPKVTVPGGITCPQALGPEGPVGPTGQQGQP